MVLLLVSFPLGAAEWEGTVEWGPQVSLSTNLAAEVVRLGAAPGQRVKRGEVLAELESGVVQSHLESARAGVAHHKLVRAEARSELQRSEELYERTLLSDHDLDVARIAAAAAEAGYLQALAQLKEAQRAVELTRISAPVDALVTERHVEVGETVNGVFQAAKIYTLVPVGVYRVRLAPDATQAAAMAVGKGVEVTVGSRRYRGEVTSIAYLRDKGSAFHIQGEVGFTTEAGEAPLIGKSARVSLP